VANVEPSKAALLEKRDERELVEQAHTILEEQRDLLAHRMIALVRELEELEPRLQELHLEARRTLRGAVMRHGLGGLRTYARSPSMPDPAAWSRQRMLGVWWVTGPDEVLAPVPQLHGWDVSLELVQAGVVLRLYVELLARIAVRRNNLARLTRAFERTQRRVRALEHIVVPELAATIREIEQVLDETERENLFRSRHARHA